MAKKQYYQTIIFILISLLTFVKNQDEWLVYKEDVGLEVERTQTNKTRRYAVEFHKKDSETLYSGPLYLKVEVTVAEGITPPLLCFSHDDPFCETRDILTRNPNGRSVYFWAKRDQFEAQDNEPFFTVTCAENKESCSYKIKCSESEESSYAEIYPDIIYSYLVTSKNKEMDFKIINVTSTQRLVICVEGSTSAQLSLKTGDEIFQEGTSRCANVEPPREGDDPQPDFGKIKITAEDGDYLTLSIHGYSVGEDYLGRANAGFILPNGPTATSMIYAGNTHEECFPISKNVFDKSSKDLYVTARIHTKYAWFFLEKEDGEYLPTSDSEVLDGLLTFHLTNEYEFRYICIEIPRDILPYSQEITMFSLQITDYPKMKDPFKYTDPMISGVIYRRIVPKGTIAYYYVGKSDVSAKKYDYSLGRIKGLSKLYIGECYHFPFCEFTKSDLSSLTDYTPSIVNNYQIWTANEYWSSAIGADKYVMVVYCEDNELNEGDCIYETSMIPKGQNIELVEEKRLSKFVLSGEKSEFIVDLKEGRRLNKLTISINIYTGDTTFSIKETDLDYKEYYLSNKVIYVIYKPNTFLKKVTLEYQANLNSFFTIRYSVDNFRDEETEDWVNSGESFLVHVNPLIASKSKYLYMKNIFGKNTPFMTNFFALNCEFQVNRLNVTYGNEKEIEFSDGYAQDILDKDKLVLEDNYLYNIKILSTDLSNYNNKMCMLYVAGYEITDRYTREIIVAENINQQIIFEDNFKKIRFTYPVVNTTKSLSVHINVIDRAYYRINGYVNGQKLEEEFNNLQVAVTSTYYVSAYEIAQRCPKNTLCSLALDVEMFEKIVQTNPMVEITFREIKNVPTYLQKGNFKLDYVCGDRFYYLYTDIGKNDVGEITLNFLREFGFIWAKVVRKDLKTPVPEANWRKVYRMPGPEWDDSLPFDSYTKKLKITSQDTQDCINGCYLLMTIQINDIGDFVPDFIFYSFSILVKVTPSIKSYSDIPKVVIQVDEFIVGSLNTEDIDEKYITEFYEIWLPHDSEKVELDWQSSIVGLYINVGGSRPTTKSADFILYPPARDSILTLNKADILEKAKRREIISSDVDSIQDINMVIGVWTDKTDSINNELYSLRVHQPTKEGDDLDIIDVKFDQKVICKPRKVRDGFDDIYRCLFMISFNADKSIDSPIYIHGYSADKSRDVNLYASFVDKDLYNSYNLDKLKKLIPTSENAQYNTYYEGINYIYVSKLESNQTFFINLYSKTDGELILINSMPIYNTDDEEKIQEVYPNSYTEQLLACPKYNLHVSFSGEEGISSTIEALTGEAMFNWLNETDLFKLKGAEDRINLFSEKDNRKLQVTNLQPIQMKLGDKIENPGFLFLIKYKAKASGLNFDEAEFGKSTEIAYKNTDLPVVLYTKLYGIKTNDLNVAITFKDIASQQYGVLHVSPITIQASILKESTVYTAKRNKDIAMKPSKEKSLFGYYDVAIKTALIHFSADKIKSYNIKDTDHPTLYIRIDKTEDYQYNVYKQFNIETQVSGVNDEVVPVEKIYHYGKLGAERDMIYYKLKTSKNKDFMRIHIAFNSEDLDFSINKNKEARKNDTDNFGYFRTSRERGKVIITLTIPNGAKHLYLNIWRKDKAAKNEKLSNYVFKYINAESETDFYDYKMMHPDISIHEYKNVSKQNYDFIEVKFNKIHEDLGEANITYFLKIVDNATYIYGESMNTIAATESQEYVQYERNPTMGFDEDDPDKLSLIAEGKFTNWAYINIVAQIQQNNIIEYVAYNGIMKIRPPPEGGEGDKDDTSGSTDNTVLFAVIGGILGAVAIALVVVIVVFQIKNKSLLNQVKHVSFQKININADPNLLLQKPPEGEANAA